MGSTGNPVTAGSFWPLFGLLFVGFGAVEGVLGSGVAKSAAFKDGTSQEAWKEVASVDVVVELEDDGPGKPSDVVWVTGSGPLCFVVGIPSSPMDRVGRPSGGGINAPATRGASGTSIRALKPEWHACPVLKAPVVVVCVGQDLQAGAVPEGPQNQTGTGVGLH